MKQGVKGNPAHEQEIASTTSRDQNAQVRTNGNSMLVLFYIFAFITGLGPGFLLGGVLGKEMQGIAQGLLNPNRHRG